MTKRQPKPTAPTPMTACTLEVDFDLLLGRARKAGILTSTQTYRLSDLLQREIGPKIEQELRLAEIAADNAEQAKLHAMSPAKRKAAQLMATAKHLAESTC